LQLKVVKNVAVHLVKVKVLLLTAVIVVNVVNQLVAKNVVHVVHVVTN
jgi:hypothetical protein